MMLPGAVTVTAEGRGEKDKERHDHRHSGSVDYYFHTPSNYLLVDGVPINTFILFTPSPTTTYHSQASRRTGRSMQTIQ